LNVCACCECASSSPRTLQSLRLTDRITVFAIRDGVRRYLRMYLPPSPADRDYRAGCLGAEVGHCFPCRDCDARFRHACKCCTAIHAITCRPVRRAQASAGLACCYSWPFRGCCSHTHRPEGPRTCLRCKLVPSNAPAGRLRVRANLNNRTMRAALAGWGARCLYGPLVAGPALASRT
jgi:hypothetical protein